MHRLITTSPKSAASPLSPAAHRHTRSRPATDAATACPWYCRCGHRDESPPAPGPPSTMPSVSGARPSQVEWRTHAVRVLLPPSRLHGKGWLMAGVSASADPRACLIHPSQRVCRESRPCHIPHSQPPLTCRPPLPHLGSGRLWQHRRLCRTRRMGKRCAYQLGNRCRLPFHGLLGPDCSP